MGIVRADLPSAALITRAFITRASLLTVQRLKAAKLMCWMCLSCLAWALTCKATGWDVVGGECTCKEQSSSHTNSECAPCWLQLQTKHCCCRYYDKTLHRLQQLAQQQDRRPPLLGACSSFELTTLSVTPALLKCGVTTRCRALQLCALYATQRSTSTFSAHASRAAWGQHTLLLGSLRLVLCAAPQWHWPSMHS